jgi:hypothetical protein
MQHQLNLQSIDPLRSFDFGGKIALLKYFTILGLEEGKARARFGENEDAHFELRLLVAVVFIGAKVSRLEPLKFLTKKKFEVEAANWNFD